MFGIQVFGDGRQRRDFVFVDDCVDALLLAGSRKEADGVVFNLGGSEVVSLKELADMLIAMVPGTAYELVPFPPERKAIDIGDYYGDFSLIRRELGWSPSIDLTQGLRRTLDYYRRYGRAYWECERDRRERAA